MEPIVVLVVLVGAAIALASSLAGGNRWKEVAAELGLQFSQGFQQSLSGSIEGFSILVRQHKHTIEVRLSSGGAIPRSITLNAEGILRNVFGGRDIEIGCPMFDGQTHISARWGDNAEADVAALLDHDTREVVSHVVVGRGAKVDQGDITLNTSMTIDQVAAVVRDFVLLARHLTMDFSEVPGRLASNALGDPVAAVQLRNLTLLQQGFRNRPEAAETSRALLESRHHPIRLAAALFLGEEGQAVVREMALSARVLTDLRIKALHHLWARSEREDMIEMATALLADWDAMIQRMAIQCLGRQRHAASLESLVGFLESGDVATVLEAVRALESIGDPAAEGALLRVLLNAPNRVKSATIEALATLGTIRAVEPLHGLAERGRFKRAARGAIESIQSRLGDVESGRLSLAPTIDPDGALSLAADPEKAGGLSLEEGEGAA